MKQTKPINIKNINDESEYSLIDSCNLSVSPPQNDFLQSHIKSIYPTSRNTWTKDSLMSQCIICSIQFTSFNRKHHCRACGGIICNRCSTNRINIPEEIIKKPNISDDMYTKLSVTINNIINTNKNKEKERICDICYVKIQNLLDAKINIMIAEFLDFNDLHIIYNVSRKWRNASIHMLSKFRSIQYQHIDYTYNLWEFNILYQLQKSLMNHSNWLILLIKCTIQHYYDNFNNKNMLLNLIESLNSKEQNIDAKIPCTKLMCNRKCKIPLDISDLLDILKYIALLNLTNNIFWSSKELQLFVQTIINIINDRSFLEQQHIVLFSLVMRLLLSTINKIDQENNLFINTILSKLTNNKFNILIYLGFESNYISSIESSYIEQKSFSISSYFNFNSKVVEISKEIIGIKNYCKIINDYLLNVLDSKKKDLLNKTISTLINIQKKGVSYSESKALSIYYPFDTTYLIVKIIKITEYTSASKPLLVEVLIEKEGENKISKFIIKNDSNIRKEHIVASLIEILHNKLIEQSNKKRIDNFDRIPTYKIIMIDKTIGIIEFVENSITLGSLRSQNKSILNYILEQNRKLQVDVIRDRYAKSLAISSCISYILGFGDRHLDNIMINKEGSIFHIDYGYITNNPVTNIFAPPIIRITMEMIDCLGGENSIDYNNFKIFVADVFNIIRLYTNIIINNYYVLGYEKIVDWSDFKNKIIDRFMIGLNSKEVTVLLTNEIKNSFNSYNNFSVDLFHSIGSLKTYLPFNL
jgi:hypothetical protein